MITTGRALALAIAEAYEERPDTWCQGGSARTANGTIVMHNDPEAISFCMTMAGGRAAVCHAATGVASSQYLTMVISAFKSRPSLWNDAADRKVAEVIAKLREIAGTP